MTNKKTVAIVGGGDLAIKFYGTFSSKFDVSMFTHRDYNIGNPAHCSSLVDELINFDVIVITAGEYSEDSWSMWLTNTVGPCYITEHVNNTASGKHIIVITSHAASWTSWPGITDSRLVYNSSKNATTTFLLGLAHQGNTNKISIIEPAQFQSKMSNYQGMDIGLVVDQIDAVIENPGNIVQVILK